MDNAMQQQQQLPTQEQVDQAMMHIVQVMNDFTAGLPQSARGPMGQTNQQAVACVQAQLAAGQTAMEAQADQRSAEKPQTPVADKK